MTNKSLQAILKKYVIPPVFWPEIRALTFHGVRPGEELLRRLRQIRRFRQCLEEILVELSKPVLRKHRFPPASPISRYRRAG
jgi:hypothetical protein